MKKRRQHYVWQHYLESWAVNGKLWCSTRGRRFLTSAENVANERDFYRLKEMSEQDLEWVEMLVIAQLAEPLADLARGWVPHFRVFHEAKRAYEASGKTSAALERLLDETINNLEEDLHASIEGRAIPLLAKLRENDSSFLDDDEDCVHFFWFIASQHLRTPRIARDVVDAAKDIPGFNVNAAWGLMRTIFATSLGHGLYVRRHTLRLTFLQAASDAEFVAGDQPILNLRAVGLPEGVPPDELELYYPLTPTRALLLGFDAATRTTNERLLTTTEAAAYNEMMVNASYEQVYARTEDALVKHTASSGLACRPAARLITPTRRSLAGTSKTTAGLHGRAKGDARREPSRPRGRLVGITTTRTRTGAAFDIGHSGEPSGVVGGAGAGATRESRPALVLGAPRESRQVSSVLGVAPSALESALVHATRHQGLSRSRRVNRLRSSGAR